MCAPLIGIIGGVLSAAGSIAAGNAQASAYSYQAQTAERNRSIAERAASESLKEGAREEHRFRRQARQFAATQESELAASGAQTGGSALNVLADTAMGIEEDAAMIRYNTLKDKWAKDMQAWNFGNEASAARSAAKNAKTAGYFGAATSLLGTATSVWGSSPLRHSAASGGRIEVFNAGTGLVPSAYYNANYGKYSPLKDWWKQ
jgi:hypothetical protein